MMRVLIADDEPLARSRLAKLLAGSVVAHELVGEAANGQDALAQCQAQPVDLVLMDIQMPGLDGMGAAQRLLELEPSPLVVFVTAHAEHALGAFQVEALDYLLKPVRPQDLDRALIKAQQMLDGRSTQPEGGGPIWLVSQSGGMMLRIALDEVIYFRAEGKQVLVRHSQGEAMLEQTLAELEASYPQRLIRIHRSALAARKRLRSLRKGPGERNLLGFVGVADELEVSRRHLAEVKAALASAVV